MCKIEIGSIKMSPSMLPLNMIAVSQLFPMAFIALSCCLSIPPIKGKNVFKLSYFEMFRMMDKGWLYQEQED